MKWTTEQIAFILYNNRSVEGVVENFLPKINPIRLINIEKLLDKYTSPFEKDRGEIELDISRLNINADDIVVHKEDLESLYDVIIDSHQNISGHELEYLINRGIDMDIINKYSIGGLSSITDYAHLTILNATCHPLLSTVIEDGLEGGGIIIPLFRDGKVINCAIRKISDIGKLKYSLACPDFGVWGLDDVDLGDEIWICEGLFDMMALRSKGVKAVSVSSAAWSGLQLYELLEKRTSFINILCDNDKTGLRVGMVLSNFFSHFGISNKTFYCPIYKDASEAIFENGCDLGIFEVCDISYDMISHKNESFNFLNYLEKRKF